jgi:LIVCS family branched-chain amino acid:cation transporter
VELTKAKTSFITVGFAIFSMFFGAGNCIFPLLIGTQAGNQNLYSALGLTLSAILIPMIGLIAMILYDGDYKAFFYRLGRGPGFFLISIIMIVIGPFAGIPRCITLSFATLKPHLGSTSLMTFSAITCLVVFLKTIKKSRLIDILGKVLTPALLVFLGIVIYKGLFDPKDIVINIQAPSTVFFNGLTTGYQMMDLLASFFFASTVISCLKDSNVLNAKNKANSPLLYKAIAVAALLLGLVYFGFSYVGAYHSQDFQHLSKDTLLAAVGLKILGPKIGVVMGIAFALACLTTIITLVSVFSSFLHKEFFNEKTPYGFSIVLTLVTAFFFSNLGFDGICNLVVPIVNVCYPALILLTFLNLFYKLYNFKTIKAPVLLIFAGSLIRNFVF